MSRKENIPVSFPNELFWRNGLIPEEVDPVDSRNGVPEEIEDMQEPIDL